ncbi:protein SZT2-like isoform X7 [Dinothrombium tinctorium]|uniref:Protein SZT2-like isoform X7 n=1 Tax=Dinothrombium tinctorium TaxID=1965070 RepID=A0A3S3SJQ9_9ACAR|nr:protein SZT2-like isoform X7 [Dinothrombium tinctorium]
MEIAGVLFVFALIISLLALYIGWRRRLMSTFERNGIKGPKPHLIYGNLRELHKDGNVVCIGKWMKQYGPIFGYYAGASRNLIIADPSLLKQIQIKDFKHFTDRYKFIKRGVTGDPRSQAMLISAEGQRWKELRTILRQAFTVTKLKNSIKCMDDPVNTLLENIDKFGAGGKEFDIYPLFQGLTMETIGRSAFGITTEAQKNQNDPFLLAAKAIFEFSSKNSILLALSLMFPELEFILYPLRWIEHKILGAFNKSPSEYLMKMSSHIVEQRRKNKICRNDLLQAMIDARVNLEGLDKIKDDSLTIGSDTEANEQQVENGATSDSKRSFKYMTDDEIRSQPSFDCCHCERTAIEALKTEKTAEMSFAKNGVREAEHVFVLMTNEHRVSRNIRANWYFEHLNTNIAFDGARRSTELSDEIEIVSVVPCGGHELPVDGEHMYRISENTKVTFLALRYRFVFILDLSPSVSSVDIQNNSVLYEKIFLTLARSLRGLCSPSYIPGSQFLFEPEICVTVLAHTPFYTSEGQQVLAQGWKINADNVELLLSSVRQRLEEVTLSVAEVTAVANEHFNKSQNDLMISSLFEENEFRQDLLSQKLMTTPEISIVNMYRYGLLALQLLPEQSNTGIVMITDGMFNLPQSSVLETLLTQLRNNTIACSFLQISSNPYPFSSFGYVPYTEIMKFISIATFGAYLPDCPQIDSKSLENKEFNLYQRAFLAWNFQRGLSGFKVDSVSNISKWHIENHYFQYGRHSETNRFKAKDQQLMRHRQPFESVVCAKFTDLLSCRLREGYIIIFVLTGETQIVVTLVLPFQYNCNIEYILIASWSPNHKTAEKSEFNEVTECRYEIVIESNYNFLHDVTCQVKRPIRSHSRNDVIRRFWSTLKSLSESDRVLVHLNTFAQSAGSTVPESIRSKIPLFYLPPNSSYPVLTSKNSHLSFAAYWKQICLLDVNVWQKWMHTHRIKLILQHDTPLPKYLHLPNANGRFMHVQYRQALQEVNTLLNNYSSFVMVENHSYIKLIQSNNEQPESFFIIRVITYLPCMVIYLAFVGGFSGALSQKIVGDLREMLKECKFRKRNIVKCKQNVEAKEESINLPDQDWIEINACELLRKPVEKLLIRYERAPKNFLCSFDKQIIESSKTDQRPSLNPEQINMLTLSKYLHHRRWVWIAQQGTKSKLPATIMSKILSTLLKVRLQEGFRFAYNHMGIINLVSEIRVEGNCATNTPCVVQYIMFPPHIKTMISDNICDSLETEAPEADGEWQLITECWIEPQVGRAYNCGEKMAHFENLTVYEIAESFFSIDAKIISTLLTFEHIILMCENSTVPVFASPSPILHPKTQNLCMQNSSESFVNNDGRSKDINVKLVPFCFDIINLVSRCQKAELWFSILVTDVDFKVPTDSTDKDILNSRLIEKIITRLLEIHDREVNLTSQDNADLINFFQPQTDIFPKQSSQKPSNIEEIPKWRCFVKQLFAKNIILTFIPSSFSDLLNLLTNNHTYKLDDLPKSAITMLSNDGDESADRQANIRACAFTLPIFIYSCNLSTLTKQLASSNYEREEDIFINNTSNELKTFNQNVVWMSMTKVVFEALQIGFNLAKRDVQFILGCVCDKTSLEVDIWPFLQCICGHVKEFTMHQSYEEKIRHQTSKNSRHNLTPIERSFPLNLLKQHFPCEDLQQLHMTIKKRFLDVLLQYMAPIRHTPSSFVFKTKPSTQTTESNTSNLSISKTLSNSTPNLLETIDDVSLDKKPSRIHRESCSMPCSLSSRDNSICHDDEEVSSCSLSESKELATEIDSDASPLFLDIQCTVNYNGKQGVCTLVSMPTCLGDIIPCLNLEQSSIDLNNLTVSLSIICLTMDTKPKLVFDYSSKDGLHQNNVSGNIIDSASLSYFNSQEKDFLLHLPDFQKVVINQFMSKIQWMLQDEIVASYLINYPINESILDVVTNHIENSEASSSCFKEEIPLKFVFNQENSLEKFKNIFCRKELSGFQLKQEGKYFYLVFGEKKQKVSMKPLSSLVPPLNFITEVENIHCVDSTELKQMCLENHQKYSKHESNSAEVEKTETFGVYSSLTSGSAFSSKLNAKSVRSSSRIENFDEDSDYSDENSSGASISKKRPLRKGSRLKERSLSESRSASVPLPSSSEKINEFRKPGQSAPAEMFKFLASMKDYLNPGIESKNKKNGDFENIDDSSDQEVCDIADNGEFNWQLFDNKLPALPPFWIILKINEESVIIYFHSRHYSEKSDQLEEATKIWSELKSVIYKNCKIVNQTILLKDLHDSRMCHDLLVPNDESNEKGKPERTFSFGANQLDLNMDMSLLLSTETTHMYEPGAFECDEVWQTHFPLHPRLFSSGSRTSSRGIQAMRSVLNSFSVNNRQNMFVYQESSGNVFYLRLSEISCIGHSSNQESLTQMSKSSSIESLPDKKSLFNFAADTTSADEPATFRERLNSTASDNMQETLSVASQTSSVLEKFQIKASENHMCIVLHVYGIGEVGKDIKEEMTEALQKKLDEAVLDILILALTRNPHCKLTPKDVAFIQKPKRSPNMTKKYIIRQKLLTYLHPIKVYLRQNLLNFLNNAKYTDSDIHTRFKAYSTYPSETFVDDDDVFLHYRQQASGTSGSKGIACIILSIVDGSEHFVKSISSPPVCVNFHCDLPSISDFDEEVDCKVYDDEIEKNKSPGPIAVLRFQIWFIGKVDLEQLSNKLRDAVKCALWDVVMEYKILTVPLSDWNEVEESGSLSAPISPRKVERRLGKIMLEEEKLALLQQLDVLQSPSKEFFSSVPDVRVVNEVVSSSIKMESLHLDESKKEVKSQEDIPRVSRSSDFIDMVKIYKSTLRSWMEFGTKFGVPSVSIKHYKLMSRRNVFHFFKELSSYITNLSPTVTIKTFQCINRESESFREVVDTNQCTLTDICSVHEYVMVIRNIQLWKAFISYYDDRKSYLESLFSSKTKSNQRLPPHICNFKSTPQVETSSNPLSAISHTSLSSYSQLDIKSCISAEDQNYSQFVPRQKIFLVLIEDKHIKFYIYNWSLDSISSITNFAESLTNWLNSRTSLLYSFVAQKMGLFHNQPFQRNQNWQQSHTENNQRVVGFSFSNIQSKNQKSSSISSIDFTDLLLEQHSPPIQSKSSKSVIQESKRRKIGDLVSIFRDCISADISGSWTKIDDYVLRFGTQGKGLKKDTKDLQYLVKLWHPQGSKPHVQLLLDRTIKRIQQIGRLQHFVATPLLFTAHWRQKVSLVRDHTLEPVLPESRLMSFDDQRSRHSSGNSIKGGTDLISNRSRRLSGAAGGNHQNKTIRSSFDDSWHSTVCAHYMQEYIQYLQTLGFVAIQLRAQNTLFVKGKSKEENEANTTAETGGNGQIYQKLASNRPILSANYLYKSLHGGLLIFEVGVSEPYVYSYLYSLEGKRLQNALSTKVATNQFNCAFLDEIDKVKVTMHLHSFTYDYHLRTIHSYISGRQLIFKQGYHLISFLEDFMKYYQKAPNFARNQIHSGELKMNNINVRADHLYNYITSHNEIYKMTVFRMVSSSNMDQDTSQSPEYVLVQLSSQSLPYRDHLDARQLDNFDIGLLICQNNAQNDMDRNSISLKYFVLLTSQRELYPKLYNSSYDLGSCRPIRFGASLPPSRTPSRKNSSTTEPMSDDNSYSSQSTRETSLNVSQSSIDHFSSKQNVTTTKITNGKTSKGGMCDEEVCYLGYFSSHETTMLQLLKEKAEAAHKHLGEIVTQAAIHCRRDHLWYVLNQENTSLSYAQFNELLGLVYIKPFSEIDSCFTTFMNMHFSFYQNLAKSLNLKYGSNHKQFNSLDLKIVKHIYFYKNIDGFMLLSLNCETQTAEINLVVKEEPLNDLADYSLLVEDFVNGCAFHLWSTLAF